MIAQLIWFQLDDMSFLMINTLVSLPIPGLGSITQQVLVKLFQTDLLMPEKWMPPILDAINGKEYNEIENDHPLNEILA